MSHITSVKVLTAHASRYLQQLCKHWQHDLDVSFNEARGTVTFPHNARGTSGPGDAILRMDADKDGLTCRLEASSVEQRDYLKKGIAMHIDRFAFREVPLTYDWKDGP